MDKKQRKELVAHYKEREIVGGVCAIVNTINKKRLLVASTEINKVKNLFDFSITTGGFSYLELQSDAKQYGMSVFFFEVLEELEKKETQTLREFKDDIEVLFKLWEERYDKQLLY